MTPEKRVQNAIVDFMKELIARGEKIDIQRRQAGGYSYKKGIPDLYAVVYGRHLEIEVKAPGGYLRPMQVKYAMRCHEKNIAYVCADNVDVVKALVKELLEKKV